MNKITGNKANVASGSYSTAKGYGNTASGDYSHAEGYGNNTAGIASHIEGSNSVINVGTTTNTKDTSEGSHAEGMSTIAHGKAQHVQGKFNLEDTEINNSGYGKYAHIVGNGTSVKRSNAHTITWDGDAWFAGTIACKYNITSNTPGTAEFNTEITALEEGQILYVVEEYAI